MTDVGALTSAEPLAWLLVAFIAGLCMPFEEGMRTLRGFGRWAFAKLPQKERDDGSGE